MNILSHVSRFTLTVYEVIQNIGLCICLYDVLKVQDGIIGYGTGIANINGKSPKLACNPPSDREHQ